MVARPPPTILLVDDEAANRLALGMLFQGQGYRVLEAADGATALRVAQERPDLVLLDVHLPDMTGFEVCRRLRAAPETRSVAVVQISGLFTGPGDRTQGLEGGADAYLIKPVEPRELLATVKAQLRVRAAEEASRAASREWRATFDAIRDAVCLIDGEGRVRRCNRALCELVGEDFPGVIDRPLDDVLVSGLKLDAAPGVAQLAGDRGPEGHDVRLGERWLRVSSGPVPGDNGPAQARVVILADVTRARELEDRLRQGQRLEAIGRLAGGIAHDFNNLLTAILGNASLLARSLPRGEPDYELVTTIERAAWRAADLTRQLLGFSRQALLWFQTVGPAQLLATAADALRATLPAAVELTVHAGPGLWPVHADAGQLAHVLASLGQNAVEAMPGGGRLRLEASNERLDEDAEGRHPEAVEGEFVRFRVEDTGPGIPPELVGKVFDPFFTTKPVGKGTGMGLAMVHGIVKMHRGWIECHSVVGEGTRFDVFVPRQRGDEGRPGAGARVLLAEDNDTLRALAAAYLRQEGYRVLLAADGREAVEVCRREQAGIDLVILNEAMPYLSGGDALREIRRLHPGVRALLAVADPPAEAPGDEAAGVVRKPYDERELLKAVRAALS
jgi:two-component system cell cycle sensor histidine kinase/response regulator CckA